MNKLYRRNLKDDWLISEWTHFGRWSLFWVVVHTKPLSLSENHPLNPSRQEMERDLRLVSTRWETI